MEYLEYHVKRQDLVLRNRITKAMRQETGSKMTSNVSSIGQDLLGSCRPRYIQLITLVDDDPLDQDEPLWH
jgi:hypothetical protein